MLRGQRWAGRSDLTKDTIVSSASPDVAGGDPGSDLRPRYHVAGAVKPQFKSAVVLAQMLFRDALRFPQNLCHRSVDCRSGLSPPGTSSLADMSGNAVQKLVDAPEGKKPYPVHLQVHEDCWCCGRVVEAGSDLEDANVNLPMKQIVASAKRRTLKVEKHQVCIGQLLNTPGRVIEAEVESVGKLLEVAEEELVFD